MGSKAVEFRFWKKVNRAGPDDCWEWNAGKIGPGYGIFFVSPDRPRVGAHVYSYELNIGRIPRGKCVLHECDNRGCVNPNHLFLGTKLDNMIDKIKKGRSNNIKGSQFPNAKITEDDVVEMRRLFNIGELNTVELGLKYGISSANVGLIVKYKAWKHVKEILK